MFENNHFKMGKRNRACEGCHRLKIKCDISISPGLACERCSRNNLECIPAAPRLQRDRISELEAEVQGLRIALRDQSSGTTPNRSPAQLPDDHNLKLLSFLDAYIPPSKQQSIIQAFAQQAGAAWPVIRLPTKMDRLRTKSTVLLLSVVAYTVTQEAQGIEIELHDELVRETMHTIGDEVIGRGQRSLELVQAMLVAAFWNKSTRGGQQGSCYQIIQLAVDMAIDLGIAGHSWQPSPAAFFSRYENPTSTEARRTWLACFVALSASSISMRRPNTVPWNAHHQECLLHLEHKGEPSDILLGQIVRITQLIQEISNQLQLCELAVFVDGNDHTTHNRIKTLVNKVDAWVNQIPLKLASSPTLKVWRHVAMIHIYEVVLHTPTNKASFAAPFIPGRIAVKDFPRPLKIIPSLEGALEAIVQNCHALIDTAAEMDPNLAINLPPFCFTPTILYALYVLVTVLVAATGPENTYGQCLPGDSFHIERCGSKLRRLTAGMVTLDPTMSCFSTRMFDATSWLKEWHKDYIGIIQRYEKNLATE